MIRASHILYSPKDDPAGAAELAEDDPAWEEARVAAEAAAADLRAIADPTERGTALAERAREESDDGSAQANGGDLGYFGRARMYPEFADPLFTDPDLVAGEIVGPVRTPVGWHVIEFTDRLAPIAERLAAVTALLDAPDVDFAAVARVASDGAEASIGGELGWRVLDRLDPDAALALAALDVAAISEPVAQDDGYHIYQKLEQASRALDPEQAARVRATAFGEWYDGKRSEAELDGRVSRDPMALGIGG
jgi:parvulin-like peptidyl-prolyl isomerase